MTQEGMEDENMRHKTHNNTNTETWIQSHDRNEEETHFGFFWKTTTSEEEH